MRSVRSYLTVAIALFGMSMSVMKVHAKPEYSKKEKAKCVVCHTKAGKKELNPTGEYYGKKKTLEGAPK